MPTPDKYKPDNLGQYKVRKKRGRSTSTSLAVTMGAPVLKALNAESGDRVIAYETDDGAVRLELVTDN